jgi:two-component system NtrC family sensor kinase
MKNQHQEADLPAQANMRHMLRSTPRPLIALLALALLLPALLAGWFSWSHYGTVLREAEDQAQRSVVALQEHAANVLESHALILQQVSDLTRGRTWQEISTDIKLQRTLSDLTSRFEQVAFIGLVDADGRLRASSAGPVANVSLTDREYFSAHKNGTSRDVFFSEAYTGRIKGISQFAISIARTDSAGVFDGVIYASVPVDYFTRFWKQFVPSEGYLVPMIREDGMLLTRYPANNNPRQLNSEGPFVTHIRRAPQGIYSAVSQVDGIERINAYGRIKTSPLYISFSIEKGIVVREWRNDMIPGFLMALFVMAALVGLWLVVVRQSHQQRASAVRWRKIANELNTEVARREHAEEALRQGQKMESLGQLAGGIAHDFNNLLAGVVGNLEMMRVHLDHGRLDAVSRSITAAESVADTATAITKRLLTFSRRQVLSPSVTNINDRIVVMQELIQRAVGPKIAVCITLADDVWETLCDPNQLDTTLLNLAINARDAMAAGGELTFVTENVSAGSTERAADPDAPSGEYAVLSVVDTGMGMTPDVMERAFEPFFTTKPAGHGTGLGLSMIYSFVKESGGQVRIHSAPGLGTTVKIYLPKLRQSTTPTEASAE